LHFQKIKKIKNIWTRGPKVQKKKTTKKKMRDQSEFGFLGHQVCLGTIQLEGKRQIILPISNEGISHTKGGDFGESIEQKKKKKTKKAKNMILTTLSP